MKRQLLIIIMCLAFLPTFAQNFHVESFNEAVGDLSARTKQRLDANGEPCALVKVFVLDDIISVEGEAVGEPVTKGMEKWVYLCNGVKHFKINLQYHYPIEVSFADFNMAKAESNCVYVLKIADGKASNSNTQLIQSSTTDANQNSKEATPSSDTNAMTFTVNGISFNMIKVAGGTFMMGANEGDNEAYDFEKPRHQVTLSDYYIGETEVTQALWNAVMGSNPSNFKGDDLPVEMVSWDDCQEFIRKLNAKTGETFSLPTEAEWEYAARGGSKSRGYKYSGSNNIDAVAWYDGNSERKNHAVKTKQANELGIYDMTGNVWEWCSDWYGSYGSSSQTNPTGASSGSYRVNRGFSWRSNVNYRVSHRYFLTPGFSNHELGLRLALHK